jgi:hypothetical protein
MCIQGCRNLSRASACSVWGFQLLCTNPSYGCQILSHQGPCPQFSPRSMTCAVRNRTTKSMLLLLQHLLLCRPCITKFTFTLLINSSRNWFCVIKQKPLCHYILEQTFGIHVHTYCFIHKCYILILFMLSFSEQFIFTFAWAQVDSASATLQMSSWCVRLFVCITNLITEHAVSEPKRSFVSLLPSSRETALPDCSENYMGDVGDSVWYLFFFFFLQLLCVHFRKYGHDAIRVHSRVQTANKYTHIHTRPLDGDAIGSFLLLGERTPPCWNWWGLSEIKTLVSDILQGNWYLTVPAYALFWTNFGRRLWWPKK